MAHASIPDEEMNNVIIPDKSAADDHKIVDSIQISRNFQDARSQQTNGQIVTAAMLEQAIAKKGALEEQHSLDLRMIKEEHALKMQLIDKKLEILNKTLKET